MSSASISNEDLNQLINNNEYICNLKPRKGRDPSSLSYLIDKNMSQSECIRLGIACEKIVSDIVKYHTPLVSIKKKNEKGKKEKDHLFEDRANSIIYYAELKANINLDTEKSKSTYEKCLSIEKELAGEYKDHTIKWCLLSLRYLHSDNINDCIKKKYETIKDNLFGINQYLEMLGINLKFTHENYKAFLNNIANKMFDASSS